jgi:hypothetical protein
MMISHFHASRDAALDAQADASPPQDRQVPRQTPENGKPKLATAGRKCRQTGAKSTNRG